MAEESLIPVFAPNMQEYRRWAWKQPEDVQRRARLVYYEEALLGATWDEPRFVGPWEWIGKAMEELSRLRPPHCSICRRHHGGEIEHAAE